MDSFLPGTYCCDEQGELTLRHLMTVHMVKRHTRICPEVAKYTRLEEGLATDLQEC